MSNTLEIKPWFQYFPDNYMWSKGLLWAVEQGPWKGSAFGEIDQVGQRLKARLGDNEAWFDEWTRMAVRLNERADAEARLAHDITAGELYHRALTYYFIGERYLDVADVRKEETYRKVVHCFEQFSKRCLPRCERVEIPYEGSSLPAYFLPPAGPGPHPTMVYFDGLDAVKEVLAPTAPVEMNRRGVACLMVDGPGQGETLRLRGIPSRYDYEVPAGAAVDYLETRSDVDRERIGIMALSMGGYYAPRAAAFERRFKICVAWGGHFDYHAVWVDRRRHMEAGGTVTSAPGFQLPWVLGVKDMDAAMEVLRRYTLAGVAEKIEMPFLVVHGANDKLVPVEMARRLYETAGSKSKEFKLFTAEDGGSEHCNGDNRQVGVAFICDWIADHL